MNLDFKEIQQRIIKEIREHKKTSTTIGLVVSGFIIFIVFKLYKKYRQNSGTEQTQRQDQTKTESTLNRSTNSFKLCIDKEYTSFPVSDYTEMYEELTENVGKVLSAQFKNKIKSKVEPNKSENKNNKRFEIDRIDWSSEDSEDKEHSSQYIVIFASYQDEKGIQQEVHNAPNNESKNIQDK